MIAAGNKMVQWTILNDERRELGRAAMAKN
jgi:hypothetical protein